MWTLWKLANESSIQRALNAYFTECYPFSIKQWNVSNRSISPPHVILSSNTFGSFHPINVLVNSSDLFQLRPTYMDLSKTAFFSESIGLGYSRFKSLKQKDNIGKETSLLKSLLRRTLYGSFDFKMNWILSNLFAFINLIINFNSSFVDSSAKKVKSFTKCF